MKIKSLHTNSLQKVEDLRKTSHEEYDKHGELKKNNYVEYTVIGKNRKWPDFMPLSDFKKLNPSISIK